MHRFRSSNLSCVLSPEEVLNHTISWAPLQTSWGGKGDAQEVVREIPPLGVVRVMPPLGVVRVMPKYR